MAKVIRLKPLVWQNTKDGVLSTFMGGGNHGVSQCTR